MRTLLRTLGVGRLLYKNVLRPAQLIHMLLRDTDKDVRRIQLLHIGKHRGRRLADTPAAQLHSNLSGTCELIEIAREKLPPASPVWDIGAHTGTWSVLARSLLPASPVVCVEPLPEHTAHIRALSEGCNPSPSLRPPLAPPLARSHCTAPTVPTPPASCRRPTLPGATSRCRKQTASPCL